jgi:hypothetical protein
MYETKLFLELHPNVGNVCASTKLCFLRMLEQTSTQTAVVIVLPAATFRHSTFYLHGDAFVFLVPSSFFFQIRSPCNACGIFVGQSSTGTGFSPSTWVFPCHSLSFHQCCVTIFMLILLSEGQADDAWELWGKKAFFSGRILLPALVGL